MKVGELVKAMHFAQPAEVVEIVDDEARVIEALAYDEEAVRFKCSDAVKDREVFWFFAESAENIIIVVWPEGNKGDYRR